jgi:transcriptional regulator GlxA family with amidase domain
MTSLAVGRRGFLGGALAAGALSTGRSWAGAAVGPLKPTPRGKMNVAFAISNDATVIDFCGPWEVFQDVTVEARGPDPENDQSPFRLYTVAAEKAPVRVTGGMQIVPDFTVDTAPAPHVVVVPALRHSPPLLEWLKKTSLTADFVMSVCTGAFALGRAGLLGDGPATTHHLYLDQLAQQFPAVKVERGRRFVERERLATAGGLTSGIDLALRVVERYFGRKVALQTAEYLEYQSRAWVV